MIEFELNFNEFVKTLKVLNDARDKSSVILRNACFKFFADKNNILEIVATDGNRMTLKRIKISTKTRTWSEVEEKFIYDVECIYNYLKSFKKHKEDIVKCSINDSGDLTITDLQQLNFTVKKLELNFPKYERLIISYCPTDDFEDYRHPNDNSFKISFPKKLLEDVLKNMDKESCITFEIESNRRPVYLYDCKDTSYLTLLMPYQSEDIPYQSWCNLSE